MKGARVLRMVIAVTAAAGILVGCSGQETSPETSSATAAPVERSDEDQIRDVVYQQARIFEEGAWAELPELTCAAQQEAVSNPAEYLAPPMAAFGSQQELSSLTVPQVSEGLTQQFGRDAPKELLDRVAQALVAYDEAAYEASILDLIRESSTLTIDKVDNIKVTGDSATAEVTSSRTMGDAPPDTRTDVMPFAREDGRWLDCTGATDEPEGEAPPTPS